MLTKLIPRGFAGSRPGDVIELYVCQELGGAGVTALGSVGREENVRLLPLRCDRFRFGLRGYVDKTLPSRSYASP